MEGACRKAVCPFQSIKKRYFCILTFNQFIYVRKNTNARNHRFDSSNDTRYDRYPRTEEEIRFGKLVGSS